MHRGYSTPLVIAIMAFAVVAFLFLIDTAINPDGSKKSVNIKVSNTNATELNDHSICPTNLKQCPDGSFVGRDGPNCEFTECPTNMNTNTATDPTAGWKTYTNTSEGYAFKYPPTWAVENHAVIGILITPPISDVPVQGQGISRQVYIKSYSDTSEIASVRNQTQVTINGVKAIQGTYSPSSYETVDTYLPQGNGQIKVTWAKTYQNNTFESILSTFTLTAPTAGWKTYTNSTLGFSFMYPSEYQDISTTALASQEKNTLNAQNFIVTNGTITADLSVRAMPKTPNDYPSLRVNVYPLDGYSYIDPPGGVIYIYNTSTNTFWNAEGPESIRDPKLKTVSGINVTGSIVGRGDVGSLTNSVLFVDGNNRRVVEMNFGSGVALDGDNDTSTKNVDIWKEIVATFRFIE